ncbi:MAG: hypothetical protein ACFCVC_15675 [Acidimicrobiia bacterium]
MISTVAAAVAVMILAALGVLQTLVAAGRPYGRLVWGGQHATLPRKLRIWSAVSLVLYLAIALVLIARTSNPSSSFVRTTTWAIFGYFVVGIAMNAISRSRSERLVMTPTCVVLAACSLALATS